MAIVGAVLATLGFVVEFGPMQSTLQSLGISILHLHVTAVALFATGVAVALASAYKSERTEAAQDVRLALVSTGVRHVSATVQARVDGFVDAGFPSGYLHLQKGDPRDFVTLILPAPAQPLKLRLVGRLSWSRGAEGKVYVSFSARSDPALPLGLVSREEIIQVRDVVLRPLVRSPARDAAVQRLTLRWLSLCVSVDHQRAFQHDWSMDPAVEIGFGNTVSVSRMASQLGGDS